MIKKLVKYGNSQAVVIDKSVLELLKIDNETPLEITTDGNVLIISPLRDEEKQKKLEKAMNWSHNRYSKVFKKLAE